jgi:hypothetical protein
MGAMAESRRAAYIGRRYRLYPTRQQAAALKAALQSVQASSGPDADPDSFALTPGEAPVITPDARGWAAVSVPDIGDVRLRMRRPPRGTVLSGSLMRGRFGWQLGLVIELKRSPGASGARPALRLVHRDDSRH